MHFPLSHQQIFFGNMQVGLFGLTIGLVAAEFGFVSTPFQLILLPPELWERLRSFVMFTNTSMVRGDPHFDIGWVLIATLE